MATKRKSKKTNPNKKYIFWMWAIAISGLLVVAAIFIIVKFSRLPDISELENPKYEYSTIIYDSNKKEIGKYYRYNRDWKTFDELNPALVNALISTEDARFFSHSGIDARGTMRAFFYLGKKGGASTITQQLAKLFFTDRASNIITRLWQKLQEWLIAIELEKRYTKEEILAMYLNKVDFLYNSYGIESAAKTYFDKPQKDLTIEEAATLIAMLKWPSRYNPKRHPDLSKKRRNVVLNQMKKYGFLTGEQCNKLKQKELDSSNFKEAAYYKGYAPYFKAELAKWVKSILNKEENRKPDGTKYNIYLDGLKIYTTIDLDYQKLAEKAVFKRMKSLQKDYDNVWKGKDPWTYGANKKQLKTRKKALNRYIKESERFTGLRKKILIPIIDSIKVVFPNARLWDTDIQRMLNQEKDKKYLNKLKKLNFVTAKQISTYKEILKSKFWKILKSKQKELNMAVRKSFNTKTKMKIFAYNSKGEKDAIMTPLDSIKYHRNILQTGMLAIDPHTGHIRAWVGGVNFKYFKFDHINTKRQVGSTFKPFIYATAISQKGISPCMKVKDQQYVIQPGEGNFKLSKPWAPGNAERFSNADLTLYEGLKKSKNSVSVYLMKLLGNVDVVKELVVPLGIDEKDIPPYPTICLGAADLSVMQMTGAYSAFSNNGVYNKPLFVTRIEDKEGKVIYRSASEEQRALSPVHNYVMVSMLRNAGSIIQHKLKTPIGGKTGTTNDFRDGWFMGISPNLVVGTWVGGDDQWIKFRNIRFGQGGYMARPIFVKFMQGLESSANIDYDPNVEFVKPEGEIDIEMDCEVYEKIKAKDNPKEEDIFDEED